jgi:hypothetical protein
MAGITRNFNMLNNKTEYYVILKENDIDPYWYEMTRCVEEISPDLWTKEQKVTFLKYLFRYLQKEGISPFKAMCMGVLPECFHEQLSPELVDAWEKWVKRKNLEQQKENRERNEELRKQNQRERELENLFSYHLLIFKKLSIEEKYALLTFQAYNGHVYQKKIMRKMHQKGFRLNTKEEFKDFVFKLALNTAPQEET